MIPQYTAASIVSQNKQLCTPASIDSIVSSNGQEDHVSMAPWAGRKLYKIMENCDYNYCSYYRLHSLFRSITEEIFLSNPPKECAYGVFTAKS